VGGCLRRAREAGIAWPLSSGSCAGSSVIGSRGYPHSGLVSTKVQAFVNFLVALHFGPVPNWDRWLKKREVSSA